MKRSVPALAAFATLLLVGCQAPAGSQSEAEESAPQAETASATPTPTPSPGAEANVLSAPAGEGEFMGEPCTADRVPVTIDSALFEESDGTACVGDTITTFTGLHLTLKWEGVQTLGDDGEEIMSDVKMPNADVLAFTLTIQNETGETLRDLNSQFAPIMNSLSCTYIQSGDTSADCIEVGNLSSPDPIPDSFPDSIRPRTNGTAAFHYRIPDDAGYPVIYFDLDTSYIATADDYDTWGTFASWAFHTPAETGIADNSSTTPTT